MCRYQVTSACVPSAGGCYRRVPFAGRCHCLVQLSTLPVAVCYGTGDDPAGAKADAARNALEYLKIMVKE